MTSLPMSDLQINNLNIDTEDIWLQDLTFHVSGSQPGSKSSKSKKVKINMKSLDSVSFSSSTVTNDASLFDESSFLDDFVDMYDGTSPSNAVLVQGGGPSGHGQFSSPPNPRDRSVADANLLIGMNSGQSFTYGQTSHYMTGDHMTNPPRNYGIAMQSGTGWHPLHQESVQYPSPYMDMHLGIQRSQSVYIPSPSIYQPMNSNYSQGMGHIQPDMYGNCVTTNSPVLPHRALGKSRSPMDNNQGPSDYQDLYYYPPNHTQMNCGMNQGVLPRVNSVDRFNHRSYSSPGVLTNVPSSPSSAASSPKKRKLKAACGLASSTVSSIARKDFSMKESPITGGSSSSRKSKKIHSMLEDLVGILQNLKQNDVRIKDISSRPAIDVNNRSYQEASMHLLSSGADSPTLTLDSLSIHSPAMRAKLPMSPAIAPLSQPPKSESDILRYEKELAKQNMTRQVESGLSIVRTMFGMQSTPSLMQVCQGDAKISYPQSFLMALDHINSLSRGVTSREDSSVTRLKDRSQGMGITDIVSVGNCINASLSKLLMSADYHPSVQSLVRNRNCVFEVSEDVALGEGCKILASSTGFTLPFVARFRCHGGDDGKMAGEMSSRSQPVVVEVRIKGILKCTERVDKVSCGKLIFDAYDFIRQCVDQRLTTASVTDIIAAAAGINSY